MKNYLIELAETLSELFPTYSFEEWQEKLINNPILAKSAMSAFPPKNKKQAL